MRGASGRWGAARGAWPSIILSLLQAACSNDKGSSNWANLTDRAFTDGTFTESSPEARQPVRAARIVDMGVLNNTVPDGLDIASLRARVGAGPDALKEDWQGRWQGRWQGQFRFAQADGRSTDVRDIELDIRVKDGHWQIAGITPYSKDAEATQINFADKTLSFTLRSGLYSADRRPFPYLVDLVLVEGELQGLIRLRLRSLGDLHSDAFHTVRLQRIGPPIAPG